MGDFIGTALKLGLTYLFFYYLAIFVFGGAACMGCMGALKAASDSVQDSPDARAAPASSK